MRRKKVVSKSKKVLLQGDVIAGFNEMTGIGNVTPDIAIDRYDKYIAYLTPTTHLFVELGKCTKDRKLMEFGANALVYLERSQPPVPNMKVDPAILREHAVDQSRSDGELLTKYMMCKYDPFKVIDIYTEIKGGPIVKNLIILCSNMSAYDSYLTDPTKADNWLRTMDEHEIKLMEPITDTDFLTYVANSDKKLSEYIHFALKLIYKNLKGFEKIYNTPDADVDKIWDVVMEAMYELKKKIPRCEKAFKLIEQYGAMFKANYGQYHKDYQQSGSNTIILENFISDVAGQAKGDIQAAAQFKKIIGFIRKNMSKMGKAAASNPMLKNVLDIANQHYDETEKKSGKSYDDIDEEDESKEGQENKEGKESKKDDDEKDSGEKDGEKEPKGNSRARRRALRKKRQEEGKLGTNKGDGTKDGDDEGDGEGKNECENKTDENETDNDSGINDLLNSFGSIMASLGGASRDKDGIVTLDDLIKKDVQP